MSLRSPLEDQWRLCLRASGPSTGAGQLEDRRLACPDAYPTGYSCPLTSATDSASSKALNATYLEYWLGRWRCERHGDRGPAPQHGRSSVRMNHTPSAVTSTRVITRAASPTATIDGGACGGEVRGRRGGEHLYAQGRESNGRDQSAAMRCTRRGQSIYLLFDQKVAGLLHACLN